MGRKVARSIAHVQNFVVYYKFDDETQDATKFFGLNVGITETLKHLNPDQSQTSICEILDHSISLPPAIAPHLVVRHVHGNSNETGTVEPGKSEDLVILTQNPIQDIRNVDSIES